MLRYAPQAWTAREGSGLNKYTKSGETLSEVTLINSPDSITVAGTPFTVARMNHIEAGITAADGDINLTDKLVTGANGDPLLSLALGLTYRKRKALEVAKTVAVGANPYGVAYDGTYVYVANSGTNTVSVINQSLRT